MYRIRLIPVYLIIFLLLIVLAFGKITTDVDKASSNVENSVNALETKLIRSRRKIYNTDHDANNNRENNIGPQRTERSRKEPKIWDQWGNWSKCSVTCGIGKITRWRHCISGSCSLGQKKAQLKTCTSAAC
ncbi:uncharacterized protein LOC109859988 [Pseudomyrmex gracilis]|uniref:uncharacterized protein LOC109859988 n=1 Tax=Pseudomyrmex gracilis TaxID=219809 RepID=UPI000994B6A6|nr:uncharacterized protein LOC109859988 [Pseudomyrmex gracilis]